MREIRFAMRRRCDFHVLELGELVLGGFFFREIFHNEKFIFRYLLRLGCHGFHGGIKQAAKRILVLRDTSPLQLTSRAKKAASSNHKYQLSARSIFT